MALASGHLVAIALGVVGLALGAWAFVGPFDGARLGFGIALVVAAFITAGLQLLTGSGSATTTSTEES